MAEVAVYCMSKAAMDMFTQCLALGMLTKMLVIVYCDRLRLLPRHTQT